MNEAIRHDIGLVRILVSLSLQLDVTRIPVDEYAYPDQLNEDTLILAFGKKKCRPVVFMHEMGTMLYIDNLLLLMAMRHCKAVGYQTVFS